MDNNPAALALVTGLGLAITLGLAAKGWRQKGPPRGGPANGPPGPSDGPGLTNHRALEMTLRR
jgi:hypothetical protein